MRLRQTHTFAELEISAAAYDEIKQKLQDAGYDHAFIDGAIDMHGIGLTKGSEAVSIPKSADAAALMVALGMRYLEEHAPERLNRGSNGL